MDIQQHLQRPLSSYNAWQQLRLFQRTISVEDTEKTTECDSEGQDEEQLVTEQHFARPAQNRRLKRQECIDIDETKSPGKQAVSAAPYQVMLPPPYQPPPPYRALKKVNI